MEKKLTSIINITLISALLILTACSSQEQKESEASDKAWGQGKYSREKPENQ